MVRDAVAAGAVAAVVLAGLAIAGLDLGVVARRLPRIRALPTWPQVADHVAYGAAVGAMIARRCRETPKSCYSHGGCQQSSFTS